MNNNLNFLDKRVTIDDINHFKSNGWVNIDLQIDDEIIDKTLKELKLVREKAISSKYKFGRVYYDHLFDFNLAAIELPFNKKICSNEVKIFFSKSKIGSIIAAFFKTSEFSCELARLFCMGNYNYRGAWHRDQPASRNQEPNVIFDYGEKLEKLKALQIGIYLENQFGFRFLKKDYEEGFPNSIINKKIEKLNSELSYPIQPNRDAYEKIGGKRGSILIFDPQVYHQGSNQKSRFDFHMRFQKNPVETKLKNPFQDFHVVSHLHEDVSLDDPKIPASIPKVKRQPTLSRIINTFNYYAPILNIYKLSKRSNNFQEIKDFGTPDVLANTYFQRDV